MAKESYKSRSHHDTRSGRSSQAQSQPLNEWSDDDEWGVTGPTDDTYGYYSSRNTGSVSGALGGMFNAAVTATEAVPGMLRYAGSLPAQTAHTAQTAASTIASTAATAASTASSAVGKRLSKPKTMDHEYVQGPKAQQPKYTNDAKWPSLEAKRR